MAERLWVRVPDDSALSRVDGWHSLGDNLYSALRWHFLIVGQRDAHTRSGPSFFEYEVPARATYTYTSKKITVVKRTTVIQESLKASVSSRLSEEISAKLASEVSAGTSLAAKLQSELQAKSLNEVTESVARELSQTDSYEVQNAQELTNNISLAPSDGNSDSKSLMLYFYLRLWPWRWDVYLHKVEYLQLEYRNRFLWWWQVRNTIVKAEDEPNLPLCQIVHYEPQEEPSIRAQSYTPEVPDISISINPPAVSEPPRARLTNVATLEELARLAFPVSDEERERAATKRAARVARGGSKKPVKRPASSPGGSKSSRGGGSKGSSKSSRGGSKSSRGGSKKG